VRIVFYISGHGLGHATRAIELIRALLQRPDASIVVRTSAPRWIFAFNLPSIEVQPFAADTGVVQPDSFSVDEEATARAAADFYRDFDRKIDDESHVLRGIGADVVLADVPPLALAAAHRAGVRGIAIANFTWDWIFSIYPAVARLAPHAIPAMRAAYATATLALRLPLHGGFDAVPVVRDIPFIARRSTRDPLETRRRLGIDAHRPLVLSSFSGFGADLPIEALERSRDFTLLAPSREPPPGFRYEDLVAAADVVVSKPGYGIVSECAANDTALLYTSRGPFIEYDLLVTSMARVIRARFIPQTDLTAGRWSDAIDALLAQPPPPERARVDGAEVAARAIVESAAR